MLELGVDEATAGLEASVGPSGIGALREDHGGRGGERGGAGGTPGELDGQGDWVALRGGTHVAQTREVVRGGGHLGEAWGERGEGGKERGEGAEVKRRKGGGGAGEGGRGEHRPPGAFVHVAGGRWVKKTYLRLKGGH